LDARKGIWRAIDNTDSLNKSTTVVTARTLFEKVAYHEKSNTSLVFCAPQTGRTHQLRAHLRYLGFTIINDELDDLREDVKGTNYWLRDDKTTFRFELPNIEFMFINLHAWYHRSAIYLY
jgi:23S rRNA-/tRNA-specific pseudouridylate synthase